jgi:ankyrin repeat protein
MKQSRSTDSLWMLFRAIAAGDTSAVRRLLAREPRLATQATVEGATRSASQSSFLPSIGHYVYAGDTALHVAAAAHHVEVVATLLALGASPRARNRRGAEPLHYAADGSTGSAPLHPEAQTSTIEALIRAGADPNAEDNDGVAPLHRAVRTRSAAAAAALLAHGAEPRRQSGRGSTPLHLAVQNTGRGGSGTPEARQRQAEIIRMLVEHGARFSDRDRQGKRVLDRISSSRLAALGAPLID